MTRIADSCGYGVPLYAFERQRSQLADWASRKGEQGLVDYQETKNNENVLRILPNTRRFRGTFTIP